MEARLLRIFILLGFVFFLSSPTLRAVPGQAPSSLIFPRYLPLEPGTSKDYQLTASDGTSFTYREECRQPASVSGISVPVIPVWIIPATSAKPEIHYQTSDSIYGFQQHGVDWPDMGCTFRYSPPYRARNGMVVGETNTQTTTVTATGAMCEGKHTESVTVTFAGFESVTVPAGTFDECAKVTIEIQGPFSWTTTFYMAPDVGVVKMIDANEDSWTVSELLPSGPQIELLDPVTSLLEEPSRISITSNQEKLARLGIPRAGAAADGVARLVIRCTTPTPGSVSFMLNKSQSGSLSRSQEEDGSLSRIQEESGGSALTVPTFQAKDGRHRAVAIYHAPKYFVREPSSADSSSPSRQLYLQAQFVPSSGGVLDKPLSVPIKILRPMVFLVHGIWASQTAWDGFFPLITDPRFYIRRGDYSYQNAREFDVGANVLYIGLKQALLKYKISAHVAAIQADVIAHSMGAPIMRTVGLRDDFRSDYYYPSFGKGPVRRLITIGGVHRGSEMADYLLAADSACVADFFTQVLKQPTNDGAVQDLRPKSPAIQRINSQQTPFPVHAAVGLADPDNKIRAELWIRTFLYYLCKRTPPFPGFDSILGSNHDLMVNDISQLGAPSAPGKVFKSIVHHDPLWGLLIGVPELSSPDISRYVTDLLNSDLKQFRPLP